MKKVLGSRQLLPLLLLVVAGSALAQAPRGWTPSDDISEEESDEREEEEEAPPAPALEDLSELARAVAAAAAGVKLEDEDELGPDGGQQVLDLLGLFELTEGGESRADGLSELAAARLAVKHVNQRRLLGGYRLRLLANDTRGDPGAGVDAFFHALYAPRGRARSPARPLALLGSAASAVTESLAQVTPYWNMLQVSWGATSPALSDRRQFPLFFRTAAPDSSHNAARLALVRAFRWDTVAALSQHHGVFSLAANDLVTRLEQANVTCAATVTFSEADVEEQLRALKDLDTRIIIGSFLPEMAPKIFCEASCSPSCDVWATARVGVPLSELATRGRGRSPVPMAPDYPRGPV